MSRTPKARQPVDPLESAAELKPPQASAARLSLYLRCLEGWRREGIAKVSSSQIAQLLGLSDAQVRKDIGYLGSIGQPGIGYKVQDLVAAIREALGINREWRAILVGVGNLARALLRYQGFREQGFQIVGLFDSDPSKIGQRVEGLTVAPLSDLKKQVVAAKVELALMTVPAEAAQAVAETLAAANIRGILNFAPTVLRLPAHVKLVNVDLAIQLEQLAFQVQLGDLV
jgi:redox-sensing transcriptional repressor